MYRIFSFLLILCPFLSFSQVPNDGPPLAWQSVCWEFHDLDGNFVPQDESGEEWWFDFKPVFEGGDQIGYIACGFASFKNLNDVYATGTCNEDGEPSFSDCQDSDHTGNFYTNTYYAGPTAVQTIAFYNLKGRMVWQKNYNTGELHHIIVSPDGSGFVATGLMRDTKDRTQELYDWSTSDGFIQYNPESGQSEFTLNGQETSEPCDMFSSGEKPEPQFSVFKDR